MEKVKTVYLHSAAMIPMSGKTEKMLDAARVPGIEMWYDEQDLVIHYKGQVMKMPKTNVNLAVMETTGSGADVKMAEPMKTIRRTTSKAAGESTVI
jgi:hypothetical protein